jgi:HEAT repeat protein
LAVTTVAVALVLLCWCWWERSPLVKHQGRSADAWLEAMVRGGPFERERALKAYREMGAEGVPVLAKALVRRDSPIKKAMLWGEAKIPAFRLPIVAAESYRAGALRALQERDIEAGGALPELIRALEDGGGTAHGEAFVAVFARIGPEAAERLVPVQDRSVTAEVQWVILRSWGEVLGTWTPVEGLASALAGSAAMRLGSEDNGVVIEAARVLARLGSQGEPGVVPLIELVKERRMRPGSVTEAAVFALGRIGMDPGRVVPELAACLEGGHERLRIAVAGALGSFGAEAASAVPALIRGLWHPDDGAFAAVADALGRIGKGAQAAGPALMRGLTHESAFTRAAAARNLVQVKAEPTMLVPALARALEDQDGYVRAQVAWALGQMGEAASPAISVLERVLFDQDESVQIAVIEALGAIGPGARSAVPQLQRARSNKQSGLGRHVVAALESIER